MQPIVAVILQALLHLVVLVVAGRLGVMIARAVGVPAILGPVLVGVLIGVSVLGRWAPSTHEFVAGPYVLKQGEARELSEDRAEAREILVATDVSVVALDEFDAETESLRGDAEIPEVELASSHALLLVLVIVPIVLAAGLTGPSWTFKTMWHALPLSMGTVLFPAFAAALVGWGLLASGWSDAGSVYPAVWLGGLALAASAVSMTPHPELPYGFEARGPWLAQDEDRRVGFLAGLLVLAAAVVLGAYRLSEIAPVDDTPTELARALPLMLATAALPIGLVLASFGRLFRWVVWVSRGLMCPALVVLAASRVDWVEGFDWLLVLFAVLIYSDAKAIGAATASTMFESSDWSHAMRLGGTVIADAVFPIALLLLLFHAGMIDAYTHTAVFIAAVIASVTAPASLRTIGQMKRMIERENNREDE